MTAAAEQAFWSLDANGWVPADDLSVGTVVRGLDHNWEVTAHEVINEPTTVYNLTVERAHTYFVGDASALNDPDAGAVWVHNTCSYWAYRRSEGVDDYVKRL